jgi:hypothetical protein
LSDNLVEQDWATFYPFQGYEDRPRVAVQNANRQFAGLVGYIRLAKLRGDGPAAELGRALLAKAAVLRLGLAKFPKYLYEANILALPSQKDWQVDYTAGRWTGYLFNYDWDEPDEDIRQMGEFNQFGFHLEDYSGTARGTHIERVNAYLTAFRDLTPELGRFLAKYAGEESQMFIQKVTALIPHWYAAFGEGVLGMEHNVNHPIDSFQIFMAKTIIDITPAPELARLADIPWLERGDLFYMQKLVEVIRAYSGTMWSDGILVKAKAGNRTITVTWDYPGSLSESATWRFNYEGPTGDQPHQISGLPGSRGEMTLTGLKNYSTYTIWVSLVENGTVILESDPVTAVPTDISLSLPFVMFHRR